MRPMKIVRHFTIWRSTLMFITETPVNFDIFGFYAALKLLILKIV